MNRYIYLFLFVALSLQAGDHRFSQNSRARHKAIREQFEKEQEKKDVSWWDQKYMLGDYGKRRHKLAEAGITVDTSYVTNLLGNVHGGRDRGFAYDGSYGSSLNIELTDYGLTGLSVLTSMAWRTGTDLTSKIDNAFTVSQIWGSPTVRLVNLYLLESLFKDRLILKAGRVCAGDDFLANPIYWQFVNNAFDGNPVSIFFNIPFTAYPKATWGAMVEGKPWEWLSAKFGVYNANSKIQKNKYHGTNFTFSSTNGVVWITEWNILVNQGKEDHGLPGNYKVGFYYLNGSRDKFSGGSQKGDPGLYFLFDQKLYSPKGHKSDQGLTAFISNILQPKNRNVFPLFFNGGLTYKGLIPGRPKDTAAFGVIYGDFSSDLDKKQRRENLPRQSAETVLELNYWMQLTHWFYIMPDIQYIIRPKGLNTPNAFVIGAQIGLDHW